MDFIEPLPPSSSCDSILVIVDRWRGPRVPREVLSWSQARTMQWNDAKSNDDWIYLRDASTYGKSCDTSRDIAGEVGEAHYSMCPPKTRQHPHCLKHRI